MKEQLLEILPIERRDAARAALADAFDSSPIDDMKPIAGGASGALTYRVDVGGRPYFLRMEGRRTPLRNPHQYTCMQTAADAGIAPPLRYLDDDAGVVVMDLLPNRPLTEYPGGPAGLVKGLGSLVARLQETPTFPGQHAYRAVVRHLLDHMRGSGEFDVAILCDSLAPTPELESALVAAWLGRSPDALVRARLYLMRLLTRLYYAGLLFTLSRAPGLAPEANLTALTPAELGAAVARGTLKPGSTDIMRTLAKTLLAGFMAGLAAPEFEEALAVASTR
jgi:hypothetical protein